MKSAVIRTAVKQTALAVSISLFAIGAAQAEATHGVFESKGVSDIEWVTKQAHGGAAMTISGPRGFVWQHTFTSDEALRFEFDSIAKGYLPDGVYNYELVVYPALSSAQKADLKMMRGISDELGTAAIEEFVPQQFELQSGSFRVMEGMMTDPMLSEASSMSKAEDSDEQGGVTVPRDQQILDDLIVDGSACIGQDCVNGESFGFDTIRVKENNLRIKFQDTSTTASFPSNDWQLTANDSSNGGQNKFSIDDIDGGRTPFTLEAGAPSHSLYVDDGGRLGLGTSNPVVGIHHVDGNTPTVRLEQDGSSGFTPQTWDLAGNEANFFIRDVSNGSKLVFRLRPGAPESSIDIAADGDIGMGTSSPQAALHVVDNRTNFEPHVELENTSGSNTFVGMRMTAGGTEIDFNNTAGEWRLNFNDEDNQELALDADGNLTIDGTLTANGSTFPDYVFAPGYQLMPLSEVEAFIDANQHLPNVPSAREVARDGLNMTHMQKLLMEKVEELTLYTIEQQKLIEELRASLGRTQ